MTPEHDGAVIAGHIPGGDPAVLRHASALAVATEAPLIVERTHASMFVIGTRRDEIGAAVREFLNGSVAFRLARHQSRPVVIVPAGVVHPWRSRT